MTRETATKDYGAQRAMRDDIPDEVLAAAPEVPQTGTAPVNGAAPVEEGTVTSTTATKKGKAKKATPKATPTKAAKVVKAEPKTTKAETPAKGAAAPWTMPTKFYVPGDRVKYVGGARASKVEEGTVGVVAYVVLAMRTIRYGVTFSGTYTSEMTADAIRKA